jgi:hypothetical protein
VHSTELDIRPVRAIREVWLLATVYFLVKPARYLIRSFHAPTESSGVPGRLVPWLSL